MCRQVGHLGRRKDDNYIALRDIDTGEYIINGGFVVSMFSKTVQGHRGIRQAATMLMTCIRFNRIRVKWKMAPFSRTFFTGKHVDLYPNADQIKNTAKR